MPAIGNDSDSEDTDDWIHDLTTSHCSQEEARFRHGKLAKRFKRSDWVPTSATSSAPLASHAATHLAAYHLPAPPLGDVNPQDKIPAKRGNTLYGVPCLLDLAARGRLVSQQKSENICDGNDGNGTVVPELNSDNIFDGNDAILIVRLKKENPLAGEILAHCLGAIESLRSKFGGHDLCVFKIGLVGQWANLAQRWESYTENNYVRMYVPYSTWILEVAELLEASCIEHYKNVGNSCRNIKLGGDSMRQSDGQARFGGPYILYCVGAPADQRRRIGS